MAAGQTATLAELPDGVAGTKATLDLMVRLTKAYRTDPNIRALAESLIANVPAKDFVGEINAIFEFVRDNVRYTLDVRDVETLKTPDATLYSNSGDCDDMALLAGTMLETIGHPVRYVAIANQGPELFEHVYVETKAGTIWIPLETTENVPLGWKPNARWTIIRNV